MTPSPLDIALDRICQGPRYRDVDDTKALELAHSMEHQGLFHPIGVRPYTCAQHAGAHYRLIFGAHRLAAAQELQWQTIAATLLPAHLTEDQARLAALQENSARHDVHRQQRIQYAGEIGRILEKMHEDGNAGSSPRNRLSLPKTL